MIVVDLDNLYIVNDKVSMDVLESRLEAIRKLATEHNVKKVYWFGNSHTFRIMQAHPSLVKRFDIQLTVSDVAKDTADHALLHFVVNRSRSKPVYVVSNDASISNLVWYISSTKRQVFRVMFTTPFIDVPEVLLLSNVCFASRGALRKFFHSLRLYAMRYDPLLMTK